jgi:hypothetical protein
MKTRRGAVTEGAILSLVVGAFSLAVLTEPGCGRADDQGRTADGTPAVTAAVTAKYDWLQFGGDARHSSNNTLETQITQQNVSGLKQLFKVSLPAAVQSAPIVVAGVSTGSGTRDLVFANTKNGDIVALDANTGATIWSHSNGGSNSSVSAPAVDPSRSFVYSYGLDGKVHKYAVGSGTETVGGGWPEVTTLKPSVEKGGSAVTIATVGATTYLWLGNGGYFGDGGDYQGHVTTIDLGTGAQKVFNMMCSDQTVHFAAGAPDCSGQKSAVWAKAGILYDSDTGKIYAATGNGTYNPATKYWGDSIVALNPDGTGTGGGPVDSYTPTNFQTLQNSDLDLGSTGPVILPGSGSKYPHIALQSGKDAKLRIINLDNMSGQGGPGHTAGELFSMNLPQGGEVQNAVSTWIDPSDSSTWAYVVAPGNGIAGLRMSIDASGNPSLTSKWTIGGAAGAAVVANNVLFYVKGSTLFALNPATGAQLWQGASGSVKFQSPVVANGIVYFCDNSNNLTAFSLGSGGGGGSGGSGGSGGGGGGGSGQTALSRTGWTATASNNASTAGSALDGSTGTRWTTGAPMANGMFFQVDMQATKSFDQLKLDAAGSTNDYPRGYQVFVSSDGVNFGSAIASGAGTSALVTVSFPAQSARFIKVVQTGAATNWWSMAEFNVYTSGGGGSGGSGGGGSGGSGSGGSGSGGSGSGAIQINSGGPAVVPYVADVDFTGGTTINHANTIDLSGVTNPAPMTVYQTARTTNFTYTIPGFASGSSHTVRLHFAETFFSTAGSRVFNVSINGTQILTNFDIFQASGAKNKAIVQSFTPAANASGAYVIQFTSVVNNSLISGIEIQ